MVTHKDVSCLREPVMQLTMAMNGPKDTAQTEVTMAPRASKRRGLKLVQLTEPSAQTPKVTAESHLV